MKLILVMAITADGKIARSALQPSLDWTSKEDLQFFVKKTKECRALIVGSTTYATIGKPLNGRLMKVMTRSLQSAPPAVPNEVEFTAAPPREILKELAERGFEHVALIGGATINGLFLKEGLVDEVFLTIEPKLFGEGVGLALGSLDVDLELAGCEKLSDNVLNVHYMVKK